MTVNRYSSQFIDKNDLKKVKEVLNSDYLTQGPYNEKFEKQLSKATNSKYSLTFNSATSALHTACISLGLKPEDRVWVTVNSFVASSNCALYCGAKIDFVDIDLKTFNISVDSLKIKLKIAEKKKRLPKILIIVHIGGNPCDLYEIKLLSKKYNFKIIEDASHALGATYKKSKIGNCKYSDISVFSFHPVKMITTGEGGSLHTNDLKIYNIAKIFKSHGIDKNVKSNITKRIEKWYFEQKILGFNYRMSEINAALGVSQLEKLNKFKKKRNDIANYYIKNLKNNPFINTQFVNKNSTSSYHLFIILINKNSNKKNYEIMNFLDKKKIGTQLHYLPIHLHPFYKKIGYKKNDYPNAELYSKKALSLPLHYKMNNEDVRYVIKNINKYFGI